MNDAWQRFEQGTEADLQAFIASVSPKQPACIMLAGDHWGPGACEIIAGLPPGVDLRAIFMRGAPIGDCGIHTLLDSPVLASVRCLSIERCGLTDRGVASLAQSPQLSDVRDLLLCNRGGIETGPLNVIGDAGALALAASPYLNHLQDLDLWKTGIGDRGLEAIVTSPHLSQLSSVTAWETALTSAGAARIKALVSEQWARHNAQAPGAVYCWIHTDYDERIITYSE